MTDLIHLAELIKGVKHWNRWRRCNPSLIPNLRKADLRQFDLRNADFSRTDLTFAKLSGVNLSKANLVLALLHGADLSESNLSGANLKQAHLKFVKLWNANLSQANLAEANLAEANCWKASFNQANLQRTNLNTAKFSFADLSAASLNKADLSSATMRAANLRDADLSAIQALGTDFTEADFTGACIQNWNSKGNPNLEDVQCSYIYLEKGSSGFTCRFPKDRIFQPGEFTQRFQEASETINLFFANGITEFVKVYQKLQQRQTSEVFSIEKIEPKSDHGISVSLEVLQEADSEVAERANTIQLQLAKANLELQAQTQIIQLHQQHSSQLMELAKLKFSRSTHIHVESNAMSNSEKSSNYNHLQGANIANFANQVSDGARQQANQYNDNSNAKDLVNAAKEIQALLDQLSESYPVNTTATKLAIANEAVRRVQTDHSLGQRVLGAVGAGSVSALEQFLNHPAASFFISLLEDWKKTSVK